MCGIYCYIGKPLNNLSGFLLSGLTKLDYRGYDSAGMSILTNGKFTTIKCAGELKELKIKLNGRMYSGSLGLTHTRWATHGGVNFKNTHPHYDCTKKITLIHNGIIENYEVLKKELVKKNHKFISETDSEVLVHLIEEYNIKENFLKSVALAFRNAKGLNAIVAAKNTGEIVAFRKGSPLVVGFKDGAILLSSDIPALSSVTNKFLILNDNEGIYSNGKETNYIDTYLRNKKITFKNIKMSSGGNSKLGYKHFLIKEIREQPDVIQNVAKSGKKQVDQAVNMIKNAWGIYFTACGTASFAGLAATYYFSNIAKMHVNFSIASEFPYFEDFLVEKSLVIAASQSGETIDTLQAVEAAKRHGSKVLSLVNVPGSTLSRLSDFTFYLNAGPERAVLSTKAYIAKLSYFLLFAFSIIDKYEYAVKLLMTGSKLMENIFETNNLKSIKTLAKKLKNSKDIYIIGRGINYPTALEGALKIKEASYIHAEGLAGGELKHGTIALIEKGTPCIVVASNDDTKYEILSNAMELKSRGAYIIGIAPVNNSVFDYHLVSYDAKEASPILNVVPIQLLAYYLTLERGFNPDRPRNLAKSVTVK